MLERFSTLKAYPFYVGDVTNMVSRDEQKKSIKKAEQELLNPQKKKPFIARL
jgi:hypothetical protein